VHVLVTGSAGYLGRPLAAGLLAAGHTVVGVDTGWYEGRSFGRPETSIPTLRRDIRDLTADDLVGFDGVCHLAALSNDPLGDLNDDLTYEINHRASVAVAEHARRAGVERFLFSSSCSLYGAGAPGAVLDEEADFNPVTPYGTSKVLAEQDISKLADETFTPVYLRNATVYGLSSQLRGDLVVNNLSGLAVTTGEVRMTSDGTPWRPLVHVQDVVAAFIALLEAPADIVRDEAFNVGRQGQNFQIRTVAELVEAAVPGSVVTLGKNAAPDLRDYRVTFAKIAEQVPGYRPSWTLEAGIDELVDAFRRERLQADDLAGRYGRIAAIRDHLASGRLTDDLRWAEGA
jgi:nucleoside-diphosphate-sugar epimerase